MTKINRLALLIVIIFGHNCFAQEDSILYKQGIIYFDKKEYKPAVDFFTKAITLNKDFKKAYSARAISFINLNEYKNAELDFERILKIDSLDSKAYNGRGMLYFRQKRYSEAYLNFNKAIQLDSLNCEAFNNRGVYFSYQNNYKSSLRDFLTAIRIGKKTNSVKYYFYCNLSDTYFNLKEYSQSIVEANNAIEIDKDTRDAYECRGAAYDKLGNRDEADNDFKTAKKFKRTRLYSGD